jgi:prolyl-tRNA synthetase
VLPRVREVAGDLRAQGIRVHVDDRDTFTPGWKFAEWEMRGVPLRLEIGPKDIEKSQAVLVRRDTREKAFVPMAGLVDRVKTVLDDIQAALLARALAFREQRTVRTTSYESFKEAMSGRPGFVVAPWCGDAACEATIKNDTQATLRNLPFSEGQPSSETCICCDRPAIAWAWFAKAY